MPYFYLIFMLCILDQAVKLLIQDKMIPYESINFFGNLFSLTYVQNYGAAFGILESQTFFLIAVAGGVFLFVWLNLHFINKHSKLFQIGLAIALGGALGNLIDRIRLGYVIDFIDFHFWPIFNVADINIVVGVVLIIIGLSTENMQQKKKMHCKENNTSPL